MVTHNVFGAIVMPRLPLNSFYDNEDYWDRGVNYGADKENKVTSLLLSSYQERMGRQLPPCGGCHLTNS